MDDAHVTLTVDALVADGHLSGMVTRGDGTRRPFSGRLGLMGAIDALVDGEAAPASRAPENTEETP